jgi:hypothetical protein
MKDEGRRNKEEGNKKYGFKTFDNFRARNSKLGSLFKSLRKIRVSPLPSSLFPFPSSPSFFPLPSLNIYAWYANRAIL